MSNAAVYGTRNLRDAIAMMVATQYSRMMLAVADNACALARELERGYSTPMSHACWRSFFE